MDYLKNKCSVCTKFFCCSSHRADHEYKNHPETYLKLKEDFLVKLFQKRGENIVLQSQVHNVTETDENCINEKKHRKITSDNPRKRVHSEINRCVLSTSVIVSETRKILVPTNRISGNQRLKETKPKKQIQQTKLQEGSFKTPPYVSNELKTSTPIVESMCKENNSASNWDYISPASTISYYSTPHMSVDVKSEGRLLLRPRSNKTSVTPLQSIMAKNSKYLLDSETGPSPNFNTSKGRRVTFSFSSSRVSSTNSSPLESVQEIEIHEEIQEANREHITSVSSVKNFSKREVSKDVLDENNYLLEEASTINGCVQTRDLGHENITMQRFVEDSIASMDGGLFSCVTNMFCTAVHSFPLWRGSFNRNRSKRSRSPITEPDNAVVVNSPVPKRPCYPSDLRLNPIRARKPISQTYL